MIWRAIKIFLITLIITSLIGLGVYKYYEGVELTEKITIELQQCKTLMEAINIMEPYKEKNKYLFGWYAREYELPDKTLWNIDVMYFGASNRAQILEEKPKNTIVIDKGDTDKAIKLLQDNNIRFTN